MQLVWVSLFAGIATGGENEDRERVLREVVGAEVEATSLLVEAIRVAVAEHPEYPPPAEVRASWQTARAAHAGCMSPASSERLMETYRSCRRTVRSLEPVTEWALALPTVPGGVVDAVAHQAGVIAVQLDALEASITDGSRPAHERAQRAHAEARTQWKARAYGDGLEKLSTAMKERDAVVDGLAGR